MRGWPEWSRDWRFETFARDFVVADLIAEATCQAVGYLELLLHCGFFVCGFQVAFITAHFPAYISDMGIEAKWAVVAISLIGFFNIIGSLA